MDQTKASSDKEQVIEEMAKAIRRANTGSTDGWAHEMHGAYAAFEVLYGTGWLAMYPANADLPEGVRWCSYCDGTGVYEI